MIVRDVARDVGVGLAPRVDQRGEGGGRSRVRRCREPDHAASRDRAAERLDQRHDVRARVLNAARLTIRRLVTSMIRSTSTRPFSLSVRPDETRSTIRGARPSVGRQLHRAVQLDAFGLHAARLEMALR